MLSISTYCISHRPLNLPSLSIIRVSNHPTSLSPLNRSFRATNFNLCSFKPKWKICCFRQDEFPVEKLKSEVVGDTLDDELVKPKFVNPKVVQKVWSSGFREAADAAFKAIGDRFHGQGRLYCRKTKVYLSYAPRLRSQISMLEPDLNVMLLWIASFWFVGFWIMPFAAHMAGFSKESLTYRGQAFYSLLTDVTKGSAGIAIFHRCLSRFRPLPPGWFKFSLKGKWHLDVALGCLMFPLANHLSQFNLDLLPLLPSTPVTLSSVEQSILARDPVAMGMYVLVVSVCARLLPYGKK